jgi:CheY-like chemotaxis protein
MSKQGPIVLIDDDPDECEVIGEAFKSEKIFNELKCFHDGQAALDYLASTDDQPFLILTDINMPRLGGIELREIIEGDPHLKEKSIPFIFLTTTASAPAIKKAYEMSVQGFFEKPSRLKEIQRTLRVICDYWTMCKHPKSS